MSIDFYSMDNGKIDWLRTSKDTLKNNGLNLLKWEVERNGKYRDEYICHDTNTLGWVLFVEHEKQIEGFLTKSEPRDIEGIIKVLKQLFPVEIESEYDY